MKTDLKLENKDAAAVPDSGTTLPARELRQLLEGVREWYRGVHARPVDVEGVHGETGAPALGALSGAAGQGKSLLIQALRRICGALELSHVTVDCSSTSDEPLAPILDLIRELLVVRRKSVDEVGLPELHRALLGRLDECWRSSEVPPLSKLSVELDRARIVSLLAEVVHKLVDRPQVLVIEDIHAVDPMSRLVLERCVRLARRREKGVSAGEVLFVVTYRPEAMATVSGIESFITPRALAFEIECRGYSRSDLQDACSATFEGGLPLSVREEIYRRTGGNPALVHWTLRVIQGVSETTGRVDVDPTAFPREFESLIHRQFEQLEKDERGLLYLLSFLSRPRGVDEICQIAMAMSVGSGAVGPSIPTDAERVEELCLRLASGGWLRPPGDPADAASFRWTVSTGEIGRIIRQSRRPGETREFRAEIGQAFQRLGDSIDASTFEIFAHLRGQPDLASFSDVAIEAARCAERRGDLENAVRIRDQLLEGLDVEDATLWFELCLEQARTLEAVGDHRDAIEIYKSVASGRFREPTSEEKARCQRRMATAYRQLGDRDQELAACDAGLGVVSEDDESREALIITAQLAVLSLDLRQHDDARKVFQQAMSRRERLVDAGLDVPLQAMRDLEEFHFRTGDFAAALEIEEEICNRCEEGGDSEALIRSLVHLGHLHTCEGREKFAAECFTRALKCARACGSRRSEADQLILIGKWLLSLERRQDALKFLQDGCELLVDLGREPETRDIRGVMGAVQFQRLSVEKGAGSFEDYVRLVEKSNQPHEAASVFPPVYLSRRDRETTLETLRQEVESGSMESGVRMQTYGDLLVDTGAISEAREVYRQALHLPRVKGNPIRVSMLLQKLGRLHRIRGERKEALALFEKSLEYLGPVPEKSVLANAYIEVAQIRMMQGDLSHAYEYLLRGLKIFLEVQHPQGREVALIHLARYMKEIGCSVLARRLATCAHVLTTKSGHLRWEIEACLLLGALEAESGNTAKSQQHFERVSMLTRTLGLERPQAWLGVQMGWVGIREGDYENAQSIARDSLESARKLGDQDLLDASMHLLGVVESARGNRSKNFLRAIDVLQRALKGSYRRKSALRTRAILLSMARVYAERDKKDLALKYLREEAALAQVLEPRAPEPFRPAFRNAALRRAVRDEAGQGPVLTELVTALSEASDED